jgi:hypothetical protein
VAVGAVAVGAVADYAAGQSAQSSTTVVTSAPPPSGSASLPCNPNMAVVKGVTYFQCGTAWYTQAYGNTGVIYMPVSAPY